MIRPGFLNIELRQNLIELARDGLAADRLADVRTRWCY